MNTQSRSPSETPTIEVALYGGRPNLPSDRAYIDRIAMVQDDKTWEWVPPVEITTTEYPTGRLTGRYVRFMGSHNETRPVYIWQPEGHPFSVAPAPVNESEALGG